MRWDLRSLLLFHLKSLYSALYPFFYLHTFFLFPPKKKKKPTSFALYFWHRSSSFIGFGTIRKRLWLALYHLLVIPSFLCFFLSNIVFFFFFCSLFLPYFLYLFLDMGKFRKGDNGRMKGFVSSLNNGGSNWRKGRINTYSRALPALYSPSTASLKQVYPYSQEAYSSYTSRNSYIIHSIAAGLTDNNF